MSNDQSPAGRPPGAAGATPDRDLDPEPPKRDVSADRSEPAPQKRSSSTAASDGRTTDPLRGSRTSGIWVAMLVLIVVVILLAIFILQNTQTASVSYFAWSGSAPVSAMLLIAAAGGALLVASAGALRILQLRRRVKKLRKAS